METPGRNQPTGLNLQLEGRQLNDALSRLRSERQAPDAAFWRVRAALGRDGTTKALWRLTALVLGTTPEGALSSADW